IARAKRIAGALGVLSRSTLGEGHVDIAALELSMIGLPGVAEDGMPGANEQRKPGTARGSPRRSRTAKASRISRRAVKYRWAREWAACAVLNAIYDEDFLGFSYGYRPKRSQHDALDALITGIHCTKVNYIFDADLRSFFDSVSQQWLIRFLKHRINDTRMLR